MPGPLPYDNNDVEDVFWKAEEWDKNLPSPGFITDFVLATRGIETPTIFCTWSAISVMSSMLKRDAYLEWFPRPLFPNFFIIFVAPPRLCAKSTAAGFGEDILSGFHDEIPSVKIQALKRVNLLRSRATPEALAMTLQPEQLYVTEGHVVHQIERHSQVSIIISELATFLGKQKYNMGMIDRLTNYYDCRPSDDDLTVTKGLLQIKDLYITFLAATTATALAESIPEAAFGDGFMSRVVLVHQDYPTRLYPEPRPIIGGPSIKELRKRLAWLSMNTFGKYTLSKETKEAYNEWYMAFKTKLSLEKEDKEFKMRTRFDNHLLKLAVIIRANRYEPGTIISLKDYQEAKTILEETYSKNYSSIEDVGASDWTKHYNTISKYIKKGPIKRTKLLRSMAPRGCNVTLVNSTVMQLAQEGRVEISLEGKKRAAVSRTGKEIYTWIGE